MERTPGGTSSHGLQPIQRMSGSNWNKSEIAPTSDPLAFTRPGSRPGSKGQLRREVMAPIANESDRGDPLPSFNIFNTKLDEKATIGVLKADLVQIQDEINKLDFDRKIRTSSSQSDVFKKGYVTALKKFVAGGADTNVKELLEQRLVGSESIPKILDALNAATPEEGLKKLYRTAAIYDIWATKFTEYGAITFLKYDENFGSLSKIQPPSLSATSSLTGLAGGVNVGKFNLNSAIVERMVDLFAISNKLNQSKYEEQKSDRLDRKPDHQKIALNTLNELVDALNIGKFTDITTDSSRQMAEEIRSLMTASNRNTSDKKTAEMTVLMTENGRLKTEVLELKKRIADLENDSKAQKENVVRLNVDVATYAKQIEEKNEELRQLREVSNTDDRRHYSQGPSDESGKQANYYSKIVDEIKRLFDDRYGKLEASNSKLSNEMLSLKTQVDELRSRNEQLEKDLINKERERELLVENLRIRGRSEDTFEQVLKEEFGRMQRAYEAKMRQLQDDISSVKRDKGRTKIELQNQLVKEKDAKELVLKKMLLYSKT